MPSDLYDRVFATLSNPAYFPGLWALLNSIYAYHGSTLRVYVFSYHLTAGQLARLRSHPLVIDIIPVTRLPFAPPGPWEAKQQIMGFLVRKARCVYLLDCDLVLTSAVNDVFTRAEQGAIVSSTDGPMLDFDAAYARYAPEVAGQRQMHLNSGALCFDVQRHWELAALWAFASQYSEYSPGAGWPLSLPGHGDQGIFNALCALLGKAATFECLPEAEWCDCTLDCSVRIARKSRRLLEVMNSTTGRRQRLVHSSGLKWWTEEGRRFHERRGDKAEVFDRFWRMFPEQPAEAKPPRRKTKPDAFSILIGICTHASNRPAREAVRQTWLQKLPPRVQAVFFSAGADEDESDVVRLACGDSHQSLPSKVQAFFIHALRTYHFDYLLKCDDDTYVAVDRLCEMLREPTDLIGDMHWASDGWMSGGAGYLISRASLQLLADVAIPQEGAEDVIFSRLAKVFNFQVRADSRMRSDCQVQPTAANELITAHGLAPQQMREMHRVYRESFTNCHGH